MARNNKKPVDPITKINKVTSKLNAKTAKVKAKANLARAKAQARQMRNEQNAKRGGLIGYFARSKQRKIAQNEAKIESIRNKPKIEQEAAQSAIQSKANQKIAATKGKTYVGVASALAGGYGGSKASENMKEKAKAEAEKAASDLLASQLDSVPKVTTDDFANDSVSGLVTGVR